MPKIKLKQVDEISRKEGRKEVSYCVLIRGNSAAIIRRISPVSCRAGQRSGPETEQPDGLITNKPE